MSPRIHSLACVGLLSALALGCGAKTGLLIPESDAASPMDAAVDASVPDGGSDAGPDASEEDAARDAGCSPAPLSFSRTEVETVFLMDGSGSMDLTWDGLPFGAGLPSRWMIVRDALADVLPPFDRQLALGAKVFPDGPECEVGPRLDVVPRTGATRDILALFDAWRPEGGTPTAEALRRTVEALDPESERPTVIVATMDGGPNCNEDTGVPPETCICTGPRRSCLAPAPDGPRTCLDGAQTLEVVREAVEVHHTPVLVVGIDDPSRPDLSDFLDEMAVAGSLPRPEGSGRRFYDPQEPEDLREAFGEITELISRCVLAANRVPPPDAEVRVSVGGVGIPRDPEHRDGWDWTDPERGVIALFGGACDRIRDGDPPVTGEVDCAP